MMNKIDERNKCEQMLDNIAVALNKVADALALPFPIPEEINQVFEEAEKLDEELKAGLTRGQREDLDSHFSWMILILLHMRGEAATEKTCAAMIDFVYKQHQKRLGAEN